MVRTSVGAIFPLVLAAACGAPPAEVDDRPSAPARVATPQRATELYGLHCAVCHGVDGRADGPASPHLDPPAPDFGRGRFRLVSTENAAPSDRDLVATLRHGMPGSSMPSWAWLPDEELEALAQHVRRLAIAGVAADLIQSGSDPEDAKEDARRLLEPGPELPLVAPAAVDEQTLARGAKLFAQNCAPCHGADGAGTEALPEARDFTAGFLRGGAAHDELCARIRCGMPGTVMPAADLADDELADLVAYVQSLIPGGSTTRYVLEREVLAVRRVAFPVPTDPGDPRWQEALEIEVHLAPLRWRSEAIFMAHLAALHDGSSIAIRLRWNDDTRESQALGDLLAADAAALQLSVHPRPPLFGMGSEEHPTNLWHWRSARIGEVAGALDLLQGGPHRAIDPQFGEVRLDGPVYRPFEGLDAVSVRGEESRVAGIPQVRAVERRTGRAHDPPHLDRRGLGRDLRALVGSADRSRPGLPRPRAGSDRRGHLERCRR